MYRLVKESGMELGVLITKKFNQVDIKTKQIHCWTKPRKSFTSKALYLIQDKRTTGYIIAYIEPQGLVHRSRLNILQTKLLVMTMVIQLPTNVLNMDDYDDDDDKTR